jgi:hypothetical protein
MGFKLTQTHRQKLILSSYDTLYIIISLHENTLGVEETHLLSFIC